MTSQRDIDSRASSGSEVQKEEKIMKGWIFVILRSSSPAGWKHSFSVKTKVNFA